MAERQIPDLVDIGNQPQPLRERPIGVEEQLLTQRPRILLDT